MNDTLARTEALLFTLGRPLTKKEIATKLGTTPEALQEALKESLNNPRGIVFVDDGTTLELRVAAPYAPLVEQIRKEEYAREVGRAGLETLSAILYRGPLTRSEIDFIRGVNSSQTLRTLTMRGLVRKVSNPRDERSFLYEPTTELLSQLGVREVEELPDWSEVRSKLASLEEAYRTKEETSHE